MSKEYLTSNTYSSDVWLNTEYQVEKAEGKGCHRFLFFKIDSEGFLYATKERPESIIERDDYEES